MPTEIKKEIELEIAHVLFIDIVGYSKLLIDEQRDYLHTLNEVVRETDSFRAAEASGKLTRLPTGDGMALVFATAPDAPVSCALQVSKALRSHPELRVRMGIHSGPVSGITDVNDRSNVAGAGINLAQRVMDCGDAGHILLSKHVADDLEQYRQWRSHLHDLGECEVKHDVRVHVVNFYTDELGNQSVPEKFKTVRATKSPTRANYLIAAGVIVAVLVIGGFLFWQQKKPKTFAVATAIPEKSIAVLPFVDMSQGHDQEYFCDGISEELLDALAQVEGLRVVARTSSFAFKGKSAEVNEIAQKLNVATVLEGSLRRAGDKIRITAQLINGSTGFHLWSETYERDVKDVFAVQDEITRAIVDALKIKLAVTPAIPPVQSPESHDLYLQGLYFANRSDEQSLRKALGLFEQAIEKGPSSSRAWAGVARVWVFLADEYVKPLDAYPQAKTAAAKAIALDERNAEAHCWFGVAISVLDWDVQGYEREVKRALEIDPNSEPAHQNAAQLLIMKGDYAGAAAEGEKAMRLDPLSPNAIVWAVWPYAMLGRLDDVLAATKRLHELDPNFAFASGALPYTYFHLKRYDEAVAAYLKAQEITHTSPGLGITYAIMGRKEDARRVLNQVLEKARASYFPGSRVAEIYAALGENDEALNWLERAFTEHDANLLNLLQFSVFRPLYPDPRFVDLVRRLHLDPATASKEEN
jgi:TolB-like protein/class 3 adenylate cyclase/Tfp pilus assembly protein PilF